LDEMITDITKLLTPVLQSAWARRAASVTVAAGTTIVVAKAVQEVSKAVVEIKNLVNAVKK
jgi:hypothetical protein